MPIRPLNVRHIALVALLITLALALVLTLPGCKSTSQERLDWLTASIAAGERELADAKPAADKLRVIIADARDQLATATGDDAAAIRDFIDEHQAKLDAIEDGADQVAASLAQWRADAEDIASREGVSLADELEAAALGVQAGATLLPAPWSVAVSTAGGLAAVLFGAWGRRERERRKSIAGAFDGVVGSVQAVLDRQEPSTRDDLKQTLRAEQDNETRRAVAVSKATGLVAA